MLKQPLAWCLVGNVYGDRLFRRGAKVVICSITDDLSSWAGHIRPDETAPIVNLECDGLSIGGRRITRWIRSWHVENVRASMERPWTWSWPPIRFDTKEEATQAAEVVARCMRAELDRKGAVPISERPA